MPSRRSDVEHGVDGGGRPEETGRVETSTFLRPAARILSLSMMLASRRRGPSARAQLSPAGYGHSYSYRSIKSVQPAFSTAPEPRLHDVHVRDGSTFYSECPHTPLITLPVSRLSESCHQCKEIFPTSATAPRAHSLSHPANAFIAPRRGVRVRPSSVAHTERLDDSDRRTRPQTNQAITPHHIIIMGRALFVLPVVLAAFAACSAVGADAHDCDESM